MRIALTRSYNKFGRSYPAGMEFEVKPEDFDPAFMTVVEAKEAGTSILKAPQQAEPTVQTPPQPAPLPPTVKEAKSAKVTMRRHTEDV